MRPQKTISSCPRCRHKTTPHCISANSCNSWTKDFVEDECLEFSCKRAQSRTCSGYAERSRKSQRRGTTERSDSNRARSVRINEEGTTPKDSSLYIATSLLFSRPYLINCISQALRTWLLSLRSVLLSSSNLSCGVVPSRHIVLAPSRRTLRARLPSLRSVVPSRHA